MKSLPECILFDLDGTLLDSLPGIEASIRAAFRTLDISLVREDFRSLIGPPVRTILSLAGAIDDAEQLNLLEAAFRAHYDSRGWQYTHSYPEVPQVLMNLREQGHRLFVVSNKPRHISVRILNREGILGYFESAITRDSRTPAYKDKADMIHALLSENAISPGSCLMVGDTIEDAHACSAARMPFLFVTYGYGANVEPHSSTMLGKLDSLFELFELMGDHCD